MSRKQETDFVEGMISGRALSDKAKYAGRKPKAFNWDKAAQLIKEHKPKVAMAGLAEDWNNTSGVIWRGGQIVTDDYTFLFSYWATPLLDMDGEEFDCFDIVDEKTSSDQKWPESAKAIVTA